MEKSDAELEGIAISPPAQQRPRQRRSAVWNSLIAAGLCLAMFFFTHPPSCLRFSTTDNASVRVPLEAHIMSKCPDARDCMQQLVVPSMEQIHDKVDLRLSFIGNASSSSDAVSCMHGPGECIGNMLILCAANIPFPPHAEDTSPSSDISTSGTTPPIRSVGFANCLLSSYERIPGRALVEDCASEHGIDFTTLNHCVSRSMDVGGGHGGDDEEISGLKLMRESFRRSQSLGIKTSCTVRLDEKVWCVRNGGVWGDCGENEERSEVFSLVGEIERLWKERN